MLLIMFKMLRGGGEHDLLLIIFKMLVVALIPEEVDDGNDELD